MQIPGLMSRAECFELAWWASLRKRPITALEVGHFRGLSTAVLMSSLPSESMFVTIDHHKGDDRVCETAVDECEKNLRGFVRPDLTYVPHHEDYTVFLAAFTGTWDLIFYDAQHTPEECERFWSALAGQFSKGCVLLFDDADWGCMERLYFLASDLGFVDRTRLAIQRLHNDKAHPDTNTLRAMVLV